MNPKMGARQLVRERVFGGQPSRAEEYTTMALGSHVTPTYVNGSHTIKGCRRCEWVGHVDLTNAIRVREVSEGGLELYVPDFSRCPSCGASLDRPEAFIDEELTHTWP